jgi:hypothetical protein
MLTEAETLIKENDALLGVANVDHVNSKYEHYLNMTEDDLDELDKKDCIAIQYILTQYAISINKQINWLNSKLNINKALYNRALAEVWASYGEAFMSNDLRAASADNEYPYIKEMHDEVLKLKAVIDSMDGVVERVDGMIKIIKSLEYTKSKH